MSSSPTITLFPGGVETDVGSLLAYGSANKKFVAGTVVVPSGASGTAFASGLTSIDYVAASPYSTVVAVAGFQNVMASASGGSVTLIGASGAGTASTSNGTATWFAIGS